MHLKLTNVTIGSKIIMIILLSFVIKIRLRIKTDLSWVIRLIKWSRYEYIFVLFESAHKP